MKTEELLKGWKLNSGASGEELREAMISVGHSLPLEYEQFLRKHNGGEGFVGDNYLVLWRAEELSTFNREYEVGRNAPGLLLFGSNGGGEGYGFDARVAGPPIVRVSFIGMDLRYATPVATDFDELLVLLAK
jgi:hypothetical protein